MFEESRELESQVSSFFLIINSSLFVVWRAVFLSPSIFCYGIIFSCGSLIVHTYYALVLIEGQFEMHALCRGASRPRLSSELVTSSQNVKPQNINFSQYSHLFSSKTIPQLLRSPTLQYPLFSSKSSCLPQRRSVADFAVMSPLALKIIVGSSIAASYVSSAFFRHL